MKKETYKLLAALWILAVIITRIIYYLYGNQTVVDTFEYYAYAMIQQNRVIEVMPSGMAYAYVGNLTGLLTFIGNRMELLGVYQLLLQITWMVLIFLGIGMFFGRITQMVMGTILAVSPWILKSIFVISPENYFMFYFSLILFLMGVFISGVNKDGSSGKSFWQIMLLIISLGIGIICTWNYLGWLLTLVGIYVLIRNKKEFSYVAILVIGVLLGICATLLKYTRLTGLSLWGQVNWWLSPVKSLRCQDISVQMSIWVVFAGAAGILLAVIVEGIKQRKVPDPQTKEKVVADEKLSEENKPAEYTITEDGRKVALLENPLPVPKKHERRKMDFKYNELPKDAPAAVKGWQDQAADGLAFDDFDISISENDDFDV